MATQKRPVSLEKIELVVNEIEEKLRDRLAEPVRSDLIGDLIMYKLRLLDHVSYVRFASVYKEFKDSDEFMSELNKLISKKNA